MVVYLFSIYHFLPYFNHQHKTAARNRAAGQLVEKLDTL